MAACFAATCFAFAACFAAACFSIAACFAMAACLVASVMTDLIVERIKHDLSWRGVESSVWHGLASARVEHTDVRLRMATVAQARRKARFVAMVCPIATAGGRRLKRCAHGLEVFVSAKSQCPWTRSALLRRI